MCPKLSFFKSPQLTPKALAATQRGEKASKISTLERQTQLNSAQSDPVKKRMVEPNQAWSCMRPGTTVQAQWTSRPIAISGGDRGKGRPGSPKHQSLPCTQAAASLDRLKLSLQGCYPMENIILTVHLIISLILIVIVLIQRSEGGGLGMGGGGGGAMSGRPAVTALGKLTWVFGIAFVCTSITMTVMATRNATGGSVLDGIDTDGLLPPPAIDAPIGSDLLPPTQGDAPLTPPRAD